MSIREAIRTSLDAQVSEYITEAVSQVMDSDEIKQLIADNLTTVIKEELTDLLAEQPAQVPETKAPETPELSVVPAVPDLSEVTDEMPTVAGADNFIASLGI